jgi:hypothetical protein
MDLHCDAIDSRGGGQLVPRNISWSERRCTACQNRLAFGAERVHSAWRDEDLPDFHASLREPKHLATNGLRKWINPPVGKRSRFDACPIFPSPLMG